MNSPFLSLLSHFLKVSSVGTFSEKLGHFLKVSSVGTFLKVMVKSSCIFDTSVKICFFPAAGMHLC